MSEPEKVRIEVRQNRIEDTVFVFAGLSAFKTTSEEPGSRFLRCSFKRYVVVLSANATHGSY